MIRNIVFDLGNVIFNFKPEKFLLKFSKNKNYIKEFISKVIRSKTWINLDRGIISLKSAEEEFIKKFPEESDFILMFFEHWMEMLTPIQENVKILYDLKHNGYKVYILSNFIIEAFDYVQTKYDFLSLFDGKIISGSEKVIKPEFEIYKKLLEKYNLTPEESIFIDDVRAFLSQARKLNMKTILFSQNTNLRLELRKFEVKI
ncbi:MAG: HAD family hydrolase [Candidatus Hodarchaeota archaeon]